MVNITALARSGVGASVGDEEVDLAGLERRDADGGVRPTISTGTPRYLPTSARHVDVVADRVALRVDHAEGRRADQDADADLAALDDVGDRLRGGAPAPSASERPTLAAATQPFQPDFIQPLPSARSRRRFVPVIGDFRPARSPF